MLKLNTVVVKSIYNRLEIRSHKMVNAPVCITVNGVGMLVQQGAIAFEYSTGKTALSNVLEIATE